jgi:hypothetical protein
MSLFPPGHRLGHWPAAGSRQAVPKNGSAPETYLLFACPHCGEAVSVREKTLVSLASRAAADHLAVCPAVCPAERPAKRRASRGDAEVTRCEAQLRALLAERDRVLDGVAAALSSAFNYVATPLSPSRIVGEIERSSQRSAESALSAAAAAATAGRAREASLVEAERALSAREKLVLQRERVLSERERALIARESETARNEREASSLLKSAREKHAVYLERVRGNEEFACSVRSVTDFQRLQQERIQTEQETLRHERWQLEMKAKSVEMGENAVARREREVQQETAELSRERYNLIKESIAFHEKKELRARKRGSPSGQ